MLELADSVKEYGDAYRRLYGDQMLPSHWDALWDIEHCRTSMMGGDLFWCEPCQEYIYSYHSCGNRHCPKCGSDRADAWRDRPMNLLLPVPYFLVTCTLPHTLNPVAHSNQKRIYDLLMKTSAEALQTLGSTRSGWAGRLAWWARCIRGIGGWAFIFIPTIWCRREASIRRPGRGSPRTRSFWYPPPPCARCFGRNFVLRFRRPIPSCSPRFRRRPGRKTGSSTASRSETGRPH